MGAQTIHDDPTRETRAYEVEQQDFSADTEEPLAHFLRHVRAGRNGLSSREADRRVLVFGANKLRKRVQRTWPRDLARQFTHPLALLLWMASALAMVSGAPVLAAAIITVIVLNAGLAFIQEQEAARAIDALAQYLPAQAKVIRDRRIHTVSAIAIVPGDLIVVDEGDRICADARIVEGALDVDMSALTGEVLPAFRAAGAAGGTRPLLEAQDLIFSGTTCIAGEAHAVVYATGMHTELGRIAALSERINPGASPLEKEVRRVAWIIAGVAVISAWSLPAELWLGLVTKRVYRCSSNPVDTPRVSRLSMRAVSHAGDSREVTPRRRDIPLGRSSINSVPGTRSADRRTRAEGQPNHSVPGRLTQSRLARVSWIEMVAPQTCVSAAP